VDEFAWATRRGRGYSTECGRRFDPLYLIATRWGQTRAPVSPQLLAVAFAVATMLFLMCSGLIR
jgi:hypothetical protein